MQQRKRNRLYPMIDTPHGLLLSIVILNWNVASLLAECLPFFAFRFR